MISSYCPHSNCSLFLNAKEVVGFVIIGDSEQSGVGLL